MPIRLCENHPEAPQPKAKGHPRWCHECMLRAKPVGVRVEYAALRLDAVPEDLRLARVSERDWPEGRRWCAGCQTFVLLADVAKGASRCKTCNGVASHRSHVQRTYDITGEEYQALLVAQGGVCFICRRRPRTKRLAVDHDHETGEVRGLLCADSERGCNHAILGNIRDLAMAQRIVDYLTEPPARRILDK